MRVDPKSLVRHLSPPATRALEGAVGHAVQAGHGAVAVEHVLRGLVADERGEVAILLQHLGIDRGAVEAAIDAEVASLRRAPGSRPVLADGLVRWFEDAWMLASLTWNEASIRSSALFVQWLRDPERYGARPLAALRSVNAEALVSEAPSALAGSEELAPQAKKPGEPAGEAARGDSALARFGECFTEKAREEKLDPVLGREREIRQCIDVLCRRRKNNVVIVGEPGVGKTALVEGLARAIVRGEVPEPLQGVELWGLDLGALQAGASVRGEFEARLEGVIREIKSSPTPILLFIDEAHMLLGAGGQQGTGDAANLLKPALARGELRTLAATTWREYKKYFEKDPALDRRFQLVKVDEPSEADAAAILRGLRPILETAHDVIIRDEAVVAAVELSTRYVAGRQLPDKAVDLLDTTAARCRVDRSGVPTEIARLEAELASLHRERDALARDLAEGEANGGEVRLTEVHRAIHAAEKKLEQLTVRFGEQRAILERLTTARRKIAAATKELEGNGAHDLDALEAEARRLVADLRAAGGEDLLVPIDVDAAAIAKTIEAWTGIPAGRMQRGMADAMLALETRLGEQIAGQPEAIAALSEGVRLGQLGLTNPEAPLGVFLFVGPSGVGKTETARLVAEELFGGERFLTRVHMSELQEKHAVSKLIGSPPGYVGYGEGGMLTEAVRQRPFSVVLLDECEKAHLEVLNLFYQVFDKGQLADGEGRNVSFRNTVIILTSNLASEDILELYSGDERPRTEDVIAKIRPKLARFFKPALLNRMTVVPFGPLGAEALDAIATRELVALEARVREQHGVALELDEGVREALIRRCHHVDAGARDLRQVIERNLAPKIARHLLEGLSSGTMPTTLRVGLDEGELTVR